MLRLSSRARGKNRPLAKEKIKALFAQRFHRRGDVEDNLGSYLAGPRPLMPARLKDASPGMSVKSTLKGRTMSETNKANTVAFHKKAVFEGDVENAFRLYGGAPYRQHNPLIGDGMEGLRKFVALLMANHPDAHGEIKRVFADGDYVILHSQWHGLSDSRAAKPSSTFTGRKTARSSSTGMSSRRSGDGCEQQHDVLIR